MLRRLGFVWLGQMRRQLPASMQFRAYRFYECRLGTRVMGPARSQREEDCAGKNLTRPKTTVIHLLCVVLGNYGLPPLFPW